MTKTEFPQDAHPTAIVLDVSQIYPTQPILLPPGVICFRTLYFQDVSRLRANPSAAALLVWAAMPVSTSISLQDGQVRFNTDQDAFWNFPDVDLRRAVATDAHTTAALVPSLLTAHNRLREAGDNRNAAFFTAQQASSFQTMTLTGMGETLLLSLLFTEADIIRGAAAALKDVNGMLDTVATAPTKAIKRFADFVWIV